MKKIILICGLCLLIFSCVHGTAIVHMRHKIDSRSSIAVMSEGVLSDSIKLQLISRGFSVVERSRINLLISEQAFSMSGMTENSAYIKAGKMLNIDYMLFCKASYIGHNIYDATIRIVDVETSETIGGVEYENFKLHGGYFEKDIKESIPDVAKRIVEKLLQ